MPWRFLGTVSLLVVLERSPVGEVEGGELEVSDHTGLFPVLS